MTVERVAEGTEAIWKGRWPAHAYVRLSGKPGYGKLPDGGPRLDLIEDVRDPQLLCGVLSLSSQAHGNLPREFVGRLLAGAADPVESHHADFADAPELPDCYGARYRVRPLLVLGASRFTWQSIAGLVVGAAGVFVFALFLVRWLRRRRVAA
jgi:hypothetical protein